MSRNIFFHSEAPVNYRLRQLNKHRDWLHKIALGHKHEIINLNFIFCDDAYLHQINLKYLEHDDFTDIITFDQSEAKGIIEGDIYISLERVHENAKLLKINSLSELRRVIAHGLLHLLGFGDKTEAQKREMRKKEENCLLLFTCE